MPSVKKQQQFKLKEARITAKKLKMWDKFIKIKPPTIISSQDTVQQQNQAQNEAKNDEKKRNLS